MERGARSPQTLAVLRMYRIALATYLTLTTMASPWLCCCATVRLVSGLFRTPAASESGSLLACCRPQVAQRNCCHQHADTQPSRPHSQLPTRPSCPCRQSQPQPVDVLVSGSPASKFSLTPSFLTVSPGSFGHPTAVLSCQSNEMIVPPEHSAFPWLTAQGILRALHILRC